jgi:hypothetical protein
VRDWKCKHAGSFDAEVLTENGSIDLKLLASTLSLPLSTIAAAIGCEPRIIDDDPAPENFQKKATQLLSIVNDLAVELGEQRLVVLYLNSPQPAFSGRSAVDLLNEGKLTSVAVAIRNIVYGVPD